MRYFLLLVLLFAGACTAGVPSKSDSLPTLDPVDVVDLNIVTGQTVFVPAYAEIAAVSEERRLQLTVTLAIHNTDLSNPIVIRSVKYYDTNGNLLREFIQTPVSLNPMATVGFVVDTDEPDGGWGSNFLVEWGAEQPVYEPVIEAVMVSSRGVEGVSFISPGRVVSQH
jgi:hypothetical protein